MTVGTLLLDDTCDLIQAEQADGAETIGVSFGAYTVSQSASIAVSLKKGTIWWNLSSGIDYESLFWSTNRTDDEMSPIRSTAMRNALLSVPGVTGFLDDEAITFTRSGTRLTPDIPCISINCEDIRSSIQVGLMNG